MSEGRLAAVRAAAIDGRARNVFYILKQLELLHGNLTARAAKLQAAISADYGFTHTEAKYEISATLGAVKQRYEEINSAKALREEYLIAQGCNAPDLRAGVGLVSIRPESHTMLFSTIAPLAAAVAAGNCVILEMPKAAGSLVALVSSIIHDALDPDSIAIVQDAVPKHVRDHIDLEVVQIHEPSIPTSSKQLASPSSLTIAVVDRSADLEACAKALIMSRFTFGGKSPFAPDLVLVNEFVKKDLIQCLLKYKTSFSDLDFSDVGSVRRRDTKHAASVPRALAGEQVHLVTQDKHGVIVEVFARSKALLEVKINEPCLVIHSMKSLDDAIDSLDNGRRYAAAYHFGTPAVGKYLSQFVDSQVSFVNHIPTQLLVGPTFPCSRDVDPTCRYPTSLFSKSAPAFIRTSASHAGMTDALLKLDDKAITTLYNAATEGLSVKKRPKQMRAGFGFFEQAFLLRFGSSGIIALSSLAVGIWWLRTRGISWKPLLRQ